MGSLFQKNFGRKPITTDAYFTQVITYIHHNPQYHGFIKDFQTYPHSSYQTLLSDKKTLLKREQVLAWFDGLQGFIKHHQTQINSDDIADIIGDDDF